MDFNLKYISDQISGITRKKRGKGFEYFDDEGNKIKDPVILERIKNLKIPPNWNAVWVCPDELGHLQATGKDKKNRKQYLYHEFWQEFQNRNKYEKMKEFALCLPKIRKTAISDSKLEGWPKEKVLGLVILTLDEGYIRIGNEQYKQANETFGLTTLRRRHLHFEGNKILLEYKAKRGKYRKINIKNNHLVNLIRECSELPGYEVFRYNENGSTIPVDSSDVNEYLQSISKEEFSSKDFRTWGGTVLTIENVPQARKMIEENPRLKLTTTVIKLVAKQLGNTQAICRNYYIHPAILNAVENEEFDRLAYEDKPTGRYELSSAEEKVLEIITAYEE